MRRGARRWVSRARLLVVASSLAGAAALPAGLSAQSEWFTAADSVPPLGGNCVRCHLDLEEERLSVPATYFVQSVHGRAGFDCVVCHGGDAAATGRQTAHAGTVSKPPRRRIPELCSRCHSRAEYMKRFSPDIRVDQLAQYRTSVHGQRLLVLGDTRVATCVDCHSAHLVVSPDDDRSSVHPARLPGTCGGCHASEPYMAPYDIGTNQLAEFKRSVHWSQLTEEGDLSSPVCNDCHGNHGASPPDVERIHNVCGQCHVLMDEYFTASVHDSVFAARALPGCATCHGNHEITRSSDEMLSLEAAGVCGGSGCHSPTDPGGKVALAMRAAIDSLQRSRERADSILTVAEHAGMEVSQAQFELTGAQNPLVNARNAVHTASLDSVQEAVEQGLAITRSGFENGESALRELDTRRMGLAVSSLVIAVLIGALLLRIRRLEGRT